MAYRAWEPSETRALLEEAHAAFAELGEERAAAGSVAVLADIDFKAGHPPQAVARLEPVIAELEAHGPDAVLAEIAGQLGRFLIFAGDIDERRTSLERSLVLAEMLDLPETFVQALNSKSVLVMRVNRMRESLILLEGALEIALAHDLQPPRSVRTTISSGCGDGSVARRSRTSRARSNWPGASDIATGKPTSSPPRSASSAPSGGGTRRLPAPRRPRIWRRTNSRRDSRSPPCSFTLNAERSTGRES